MARHARRHRKGPGGPKHNWPLQRGFDRYYGTIHGAGSYFDPSALVRDNTADHRRQRPGVSPGGILLHRRDQPTTRCGSSATMPAIMPRQPFFLYVAYTAAHWPMHAKEADIAKYRGPLRRRATSPSATARLGQAEEARARRRAMDAELPLRRATGTR